MKAIKLVEKIVLENMYNTTFVIVFVSTDGNKQTVYVDAPNERSAMRIFERDYDYDEIISIKQDTNEIHRQHIGSV